MKEQTPWGIRASNFTHEQVTLTLADMRTSGSCGWTVRFVDMK